MNILIDRVPSIVEIDNEKYEINADFRTSILFELMMSDDTLTEQQKLIYTLQLYYTDIPTNTNEAIEKVLWFYRCGKDVKTSGSGGSSSNTKIYDFEVDDDYIYSAFLSQYKLDLQDVGQLHWWKFKALFKSLKADNKIVEIMGYRGVNLSDIKDKDQKEFYKKMQELYRIPTSQDEIEKINYIEEILLNGGDISTLK